MTSIHPGQLYQQAVDILNDYGGQIILGGLTLAVGLVVVSFLIARHKGRTDRWLSNLASIVVLGFMSEGMWEVASETLDFPLPLAAMLFFVGEVMMVNSAAAAMRQYRRTTEYSEPDEHGNRTVTKPGHPGPHGTAVWVIAIASGLIVGANAAVAGNAGWGVEFLLRLALPVGAAYVWYANLTSEGTSRPVGVWRWTPRRFLAMIGAIDPRGLGLAEVDRQRRLDALVVTARRVHRGTWPGKFHSARLERLARHADRAMIVEAAHRVRRAEQIQMLLDPTVPVETIESERVEPLGLEQVLGARAAAGFDSTRVGTGRNGRVESGRDEGRTDGSDSGSAESTPAGRDAWVGPVGTTVRQNGSAHSGSVGTTGDQPPRPGDVERLLALVADGTLTLPLTEADALAHLKPIGAKYARRAYKAANDAAALRNGHATH